MLVRYKNAKELPILETESDIKNIGKNNTLNLSKYRECLKYKPFKEILLLQIGGEATKKFYFSILIYYNLKNKCCVIFP